MQNIHSPKGGTENIPNWPGRLSKGASPSGVLKVESLTSWVRSLIPAITTTFGTRDDPSHSFAQSWETTISDMITPLPLSLPWWKTQPC